MPNRKDTKPGGLNGGYMIFNHDLIDQAISELKKVENDLNDLYQKLRLIANSLSVKPEWYERLEAILKMIENAGEKSKNHTRILQRATELYEVYDREAAYAADSLPALISNQMVRSWITEVDIRGLDTIKNELNPMLCNHLLQHEEWLVNHMLSTLSPEEGEKAVR